MKIPLAMSLLALLCLSPSALAEEHSGLWLVYHTDGRPLELRLYADHSAWSDFPDNNPGQWSLKNGSLYCSWSDGWVDILSKEQGVWRKTAFKPGQPLNPRIGSRAHYLSSNPDGWFGIKPREMDQR